MVVWSSRAGAMHVSVVWAVTMVTLVHAVPATVTEIVWAVATSGFPAAGSFWLASPTAGPKLVPTIVRVVPPK